MLGKFSTAELDAEPTYTIIYDGSGLTLKANSMTLKFLMS